MDKTFQKLLQTDIDLSSLGVERRTDNEPYFCTPKGASVFGWTGVDGIHFCFVRGFGGMVFAVSPANTFPNYVHPLAKNFADFLRLLLACGDVAALEQAWMWDKAQFETFLQDNPPTQEQQETLALVATKLKLMPMERPWAYIKELQASFDYSKIKYTKEYYDVVDQNAKPAIPEWKVYFEGNFWGHSGKERAGTEVPLNQQFEWAGHHWIIPAAYSCSKGFVVDFCMRTPEEDIRKFMTKWDLHPENDSCEYFTQEQQLQIDLENPLCLDFIPRLELNGKTMLTSHGCSVVFNPCLPDGMINEAEAKWALEHYDLDTSYGWMIFRAAFPWTSKRRPEIKSLSLTMEQRPCRVPGPHFQTHAPGDSFSFLHPVSGTNYTLTVQEIEQQTIPQKCFGSDRWVYPTHFTVMRYTLFPESEEDISICDCCDGDKPMEIAVEGDSFTPETQNNACVGIIGGADGPTVIMTGEKSQGRLYAACSALHFEPVRDDVEWCTMFSIKNFDETTMLKEGFYHRPLTVIRPIDIENFLKVMRRDGRSDSYISKARGMLYQIFQKAEANDLVRRNPVRLAEKMRASGTAKRKEAFTTAEVAHLMKVLPDDRMGLSIRLLLGTGMRMQELLALEPQFIEEDGSVIHIRQAVKVVKGTVSIGSPKSKDSIRDIPVPLNVRPCAIKLRDTTDQFIWESPKTGLPCNPTHFRDVFRKSLEEAGDVRLLTPHSCRHTYVSQMQALGVDIQTIQSIVGHADTEMTEHYLHVQESIRQSAIQLFSEAFSA